MSPGDYLKLFNRIFDANELMLYRDGNPRTTYSLRQTYICLRLIEGVDIDQIAKNCRTSVEMIEKYYASHIKNTLHATAINVMRPHGTKGGKPASNAAAGSATGKARAAKLTAAENSRARSGRGWRLKPLRRIPPTPRS